MYNVLQIDYHIYSVWFHCTTRGHMPLILSQFWHLQCVSLYKCTTITILSLVLLFLVSPDLISSPEKLSSTTYPNGSVRLSWNQPSDNPQCVDHYVVNVTSKHYSYMITTHYKRMQLDGLDPEEYKISMAGVDAVNSTGEYQHHNFSIHGTCVFVLLYMTIL